MLQGVRPVGPARGWHGDEGHARLPDGRVVVLRDRDLVAIRSQEVLELRLRHRRAPFSNELKAPRIEIEPDDLVAARGETRQHRRPNPPEPDDGDCLVPHPRPALLVSPSPTWYSKHIRTKPPRAPRRKRDDVERREDMGVHRSTTRPDQ